MVNRVIIFDTTLRDGEQAPGFSMNLDEKIRMAEQLQRLGVDVIEAGFPIASEGDFLAVREIARMIQKCTVAGLCRTKKEDIDRAWEALKYAKHPRIHTFIATSDIHLKFKLKKSRKEVLQDAVQGVQYCRSLCEDVEFSAEDASRSDPEFLIEIFSAAIEAGATVINVPDTVGYSIPWEFGSLIAQIVKNVPKINEAILSVHCHNDLGLAVANSLAAVQNGARQVECTMNGAGERAGNASLEEIVMALKTRQSNFGFNTNIQTNEIFPTSQLLSEITEIGVQPNKAIVGRNAFAHEAGIHQDGVLKNPMTYEIMTPQSIGLPTNTLVLGKHSGRNALNNRYKELGFNFERADLDKIYREFIKIADLQKIVRDEDLISIAKNRVSEINNEVTKNNVQLNYHEA